MKGLVHANSSLNATVSSMVRRCPNTSPVWNFDVPSAKMPHTNIAWVWFRITEHWQMHDEWSLMKISVGGDVGFMGRHQPEFLAAQFLVSAASLDVGGPRAVGFGQIRCAYKTDESLPGERIWRDFSSKFSYESAVAAFLGY
jgi:hypothetical protein